MSTGNISGPGLLFVTSQISRKDVLDERTFMDWYDNDHIDEIVKTGGIKDAFRYLDVTGQTSKPYLAFYPMADLAFTLGERFKHIRVKSDKLPEPGIFYDLADIDVRYLGLAKTIGERGGAAQCLITVGVEPDTDSKATDVMSWLESQHTDTVKAIPGYARTTIYTLLYARSNAQSRALKGLPTTDAPSPEPPTCQAIHEFTRVLSTSELEKIQSVAAREPLLEGAKQLEIGAWKLAKAHGEKRFFD